MLVKSLQNMRRDDCHGLFVQNTVAHPICQSK